MDPESGWCLGSSGGAETVRTCISLRSRPQINSVFQSATVVSWFMLAMLAHPEVQEKCQEELDAVVGRHRMPRFSDLEDLPYIRATAREVLRWRTVAPIGGCRSSKCASNPPLTT